VNDDHAIPTGTTAPTRELPDLELTVDFGAPAPGSDNPMSAERRGDYENRIRQSVETQAAGAEKASQIFVR
jgi:hypothetical protein